LPLSLSLHLEEDHYPKKIQFFCCMDRKQDAIVVLAYRSKITNTTVLLQTSTNPDVND
jgi:hypothetical protein